MSEVIQLGHTIILVSHMGISHHQIVIFCLITLPGESCYQPLSRPQCCPTLTNVKDTEIDLPLPLLCAFFLISAPWLSFSLFINYLLFPKAIMKVNPSRKGKRSAQSSVPAVSTCPGLVTETPLSPCK